MIICLTKINSDIGPHKRRRLSAQLSHERNDETINVVGRVSNCVPAWDKLADSTAER